MSVRINEQKSRVTGTVSMQVLVEGDRADELTSLNVRNEVLKYARSAGFPARGLGGVPNPYPVGVDGDTDDTEMIFGRRPIDHWEAVYTVNAGLGA